MIGFRCDYLEGCHPLLLEALVESNEAQAVGYGLDQYTLEAEALILQACDSPDSQVHFLVGGTQTNKTVLAWLLQPWEGVIAPETGHIATHETGAIESTGHKVLTVASVDGKLAEKSVRGLCERYFHGTHLEHEVAPGVLYVSQPTESGTLYSLEELQLLREVCDEFGLCLFVDGARLCYALGSPENTVSLSDLARISHVFYIGGTKCGALCGEAVVLHPDLGARCQQFRNMVKQTGGILAKGRLLGVQFRALFQAREEMGNTLYQSVGQGAVSLALALREAFRQRGIALGIESGTNQQFPILTQEQMDFFAKNFSFELWEPLEDGRFMVRFCTSWATKSEDVQFLIQEVGRCPIT